ncbi:hypothetical protein LZ578_08740 [Jeotgalibaca sp. MA1X17-3]|uniref:hypothetical protein n=1 Tax=Jeotgalibaca sp. MA1X17-3 TaxID=2908211 RepID=UPI001F446890|nr:hypothetical protein [Jeotgalibaca sp. MA1X17-3]UJF15084.1 hypothetical protein LZ578_08740 [Jeotgalibaca sp. MA1X17-3]
MSLQQLVAKRVDYKKGLKVGEIVQYEEKNFVVIQINKVSVTIIGAPLLKIEFIGQEVGKRIDYSKYKHFFTYKKRYNISKGEKKFEKIGSVMTGTEKERPIIKIISIEKVEYDFLDVVITYQVELLQPWNDYMINKAVKENRLSTFKIISNDDVKKI